MKLGFLNYGICMSLLLSACSPGTSGDSVGLNDIQGNSIVGVGIQPTYVSGHPVNSMVMIEVKSSSGIGMCGGLLIGRRTVLTAQHCLAENGEALVLFPDKDSTTSTKSGDSVKVISQYQINTEQVMKDMGVPYQRESHNSPPTIDIGVMLLASDAPARVPTFNFSQIATDQELKEGQLIALGWDTNKTKAKSGIFTGASFNNVLRAQNGSMRLVSDKEVDQLIGGPDSEDYDYDKVVYGNTNKQLKLVTRTANYICQGDSGSPLFVRTKAGSYKLAGVTSAIIPSNKFNKTECGNLAVYQTVEIVRARIQKVIR